MGKRMPSSFLELDVDNDPLEPQFVALYSASPNEFLNFITYSEGGRQLFRTSLKARQLVMLRDFLNTLELPDVPMWDGQPIESLDELLDVAYDVEQERSSDFLDFLREYAANRR